MNLWQRFMVKILSRCPICWGALTKIIVGVDGDDNVIFSAGGFCKNCATEWVFL